MESSLPNCGICILAGGLSGRMGLNKAGLRLGSRTLLRHIRVEAQKTGLPVRVIRHDLVPRCGPMGGVFTGLKTSRAEGEIFLACDMPFVSTRLMERLLEFWQVSHRPVFLGLAGLAGFPFLAPVEALPIVEREMSRRRYSLQRLAQVLRAKIIPPLRAEEPQLFNVNTPSDWQLALQRWKSLQKTAQARRGPEKEFARAACK